MLLSGLKRSLLVDHMSTLRAVLTRSCANNCSSSIAKSTFQQFFILRTVCTGPRRGLTQSRSPPRIRKRPASHLLYSRTHFHRNFPVDLLALAHIKRDRATLRGCITGQRFFCSGNKSSGLATMEPVTAHTEHRLPTDVKPIHYDLTIRTDLEELKFDGSVKIE